MKFVYLAYGLRCAANVAIPGFQEEHSDEASDDRFSDLSLTVSSTLPYGAPACEKLPRRVCYQKTLPVDPTDSTYAVSVLGNEQYFELAYSDGAKFLVDESGGAVWAYCPGTMSLDYFVTYIRGPVMGFVLRRRGRLALHASAVKIGDYAVVLCGESQSGKSTVAAALALRKNSVLSEDITAIEFSDGTIYAVPGHSQVGLWPDMTKTLFGSETALPRFTASWDKRVLDLHRTTGGFDSKARPIAAIYVLGPRDPDSAAPFAYHLEGRAAFFELLQNTYMNWLLTPDQRRSEFDDLARLVATVPVRRLVPHEQPERLAKLCDLIVTDTRGRSGSNGELAQCP